MSEPEGVSRIQSPALSAEFFLDPLESEFLCKPVAQLRNVRILEPSRARSELARFFDWCAENQVSLCSCRVRQDQRIESLLLEDGGFRWIELNFCPELDHLQDLTLAGGEVAVKEADEGDRTTLGEMAGLAFDYGRFHQDPRLGPAIGNRRYRHWLEGAFDASHQRVLKCILKDQTIGFVVAEHPEEDEVFWSLMALGPDWRGRGLGRKTWEAILRYHQRAGVTRVVTSISSHNLSALNLYARLGWRFPAPLSTFHWCRGE